MNKNFFLSVKYFLNKIKKFLCIFLLFFIFSENIFWFNLNNNEKNFSENFFSDIYNKTEYQKTSLKRLSSKLWLDEKFLNNFLNPQNSNKKISLWIKCDKNKWNFCKMVKKDNSHISYYENILRNKIQNEIKIVKLEEKLQSIWENEEIFADWDYNNSFFDVVTQWNIIDAILFWKDWMTPFYKYKKKKKNNNDNNSNDNNVENKIKNQIQDWKSKEKTNKETSYFNSLNQSESQNIKKLSDKKNFYWKIKNSKEIKKKLQICIDPFLVEKNSWNEKIFSKTEKNKSITDKILKETWNSWKNISEITDKINLEWYDFQISENWFIKPNEKVNSWKECKKPLYWWYICLDSSFWKCYPIWKKISEEMWENWQFCVDIRFITGSQDLLWNWKSANCINCYIEKWLQIIEDKLYWEALYPRRNKIKNWNLPNLSWLKRMFSFLDISYVPMPWDKENYRKNEKKEKLQLKESCSPSFKNKFQQSEWYFSKFDKLTTEEQKIVNEYCRNNILNEKNKEKAAILKDAYFWDVNWRISEFRNLFQNWILDNIQWMPFNKLENMKSCQEVQNN